MIVGVGIDRVLLHRVDQIYERWGKRFTERVLGQQEQLVFQERLGRGSAGRSRAVSYLAKRFAAKEAVGKALGVGLAYPMSLHSLEVLNDAKGAPHAVFHKALVDWVSSRQLRVNVSLSDEQDAAVALAIVESNAGPQAPRNMRPKD